MPQYLVSTPGGEIISHCNFKMLTTLRDKLQTNQDFKEGNLDIDGLCSELRSKARCSESGVVIDQKDVDEALKRLPAKKASNAGTPQAA